MEKIIECVPNFSEGRNGNVIREIVDAIDQTHVGKETVKVLHIDPGQATNRTVVTFIGSPEAVCEAAFQGAKKAAEVIDMRTHHGTHPRSGSTDVLPLIPVTGVSLEECAQMARRLAERLYEELGIPCYCYEAAALRPERKNLAVCRSGEYEALPAKLADPRRAPDFGPKQMTEMAEKAGAVNVGARNFLIAVNFNLDSTSTRLAQEIAEEVREKGKKIAPGIWKPGSLKGCKAIGWFIEEYGIAQVSMNITDIHVVPLHVAFEEVSRVAQEKGLHVTGTEIIGLIPKASLLEAADFYLDRKKDTSGKTEEEKIQTAIEAMHLDELRPFLPEEKIIDFH